MSTAILYMREVISGLYIIIMECTVLFEKGSRVKKVYYFV